MRKKVFGALSLLAGLIVFGFLWLYSQDQQTIGANGEFGELVPPGEYWSEKNGRYAGEQYFINLQFKDKKGNVVNVGRREVSKRILDKLDAGERVMVKYVPTDTSVMQIVGNDTDKEFQSKMFWFGSALTIYGLYVLLSKRSIDQET